MARLGRKITASTLMETLVATIIILVVFVAASLVLNNTFKTIVANDRFNLDNRIRFIEYKYQHNEIALPYLEDFERFEIYISKEYEEAVGYIMIEITEKESRQTTFIQKVDENK